MKLTFGTGFVCPECGEEVDYITGFWSMFTTGGFIEACMKRLDREGGVFTSEKCGHTWRIEPGSRNRV